MINKKRLTGIHRSFKITYIYEDNKNQKIFKIFINQTCKYEKNWYFKT